MSLLLETEIHADTLDRARAGDGAAHATLYANLAGPLYTLIRRLVVRPAVAEELLQDVFVEILRNLAAYNGSGSFAGWVRSIAVSKALMHLRSPWHRRLLSMEADGVRSLAELAQAPEEGADGGESELEAALNQLPATARSVVWLHDVEGYTHQEIARLFGRTASFSKSQLARAHEQLRQALEFPTDGLVCTPPLRS